MADLREVFDGARRRREGSIESPEGELVLAQSVIYLTTAPKSNAGCHAYGQASKAAKETVSLVALKHILNAPTDLMEDLGYGTGYK